MESNLKTLFEGLATLNILISSLDSNTDMNEAQTRFHIIDKLLFECLGWSKDEVEVEKSEQRKFSDYELGKPRLAILEAKREGQYFVIPAGSSKSLIRDLPSLMKISKDAESAIKQAQEYCSQRGVPIAIVSNGHQYIVFLASRQDGISVYDGKAVVFTSLNHLSENFSTAWQLLSEAGVKQRNISRYLVSGECGMPNKLSSKLANYPVVRYRSDTHATLRQLSELFLQDIIENEEMEEKFFSECYCDSGALSQYALLSKNILEARYASLFNESESIPYIAPVKERKNDNFSPDILAEAVARRPIVLLGDVGVGKTSFVKNLIYNSAHKEFKNAIYIYIDLGSKAALADDLKSFVLNEIESQLQDKYNIDVMSFKFIKGIYASDIHRFSKGIWGEKKDSNPDLYETKLLEMLDNLTKEKDQHLKRCVNGYAKSTKKQVIISLDNADQRDFDIQQRTFIIAQELAKDWNSAVFISVRPQTFFKSKRSGALAAYPHKIFTISPPRIDVVIKKRLQFALSMAEGTIPIETINNMRVNSGNLSKFLKALISSLSESSDLYEFLSNITGGNIRAAIEFVTGFIGSPNVDVDKIIRIMNEEGKYRIPLHEFTKSALLGEYSHYNPDTSIAMNVYDISSTDSKEYFINSIFLAFLESSGEHLDNDGFCLTSKLFEELQSLGFTNDQICHSLRRCTNKKLIETCQRVTFEEDINGALIGEMPESFRITTIGAYHLKRWLGVFSYFDAMVFDTPILDQSTREKMMIDINSFSIDRRYKRAYMFRNYLQSIWNDMAHKPKYFDFNELIRDGAQTFNSVQRAIENNSHK
ncbi:MAG: GTPase SAR1 family protein [Motiliproteus sp.]|jgi:GTPase SAR1 family protein